MRVAGIQAPGQDGRKYRHRHRRDRRRASPATGNGGSAHADSPLPRYNSAASMYSTDSPSARNAAADSAQRTTPRVFARANVMSRDESSIKPIAMSEAHIFCIGVMSRSRLSIVASLLVSASLYHFRRHFRRASSEKNRPVPLRPGTGIGRRHLTIFPTASGSFGSNSPKLLRSTGPP